MNSKIFNNNNKNVMIMKKNLFLAAMAIVALASCTSDEYVGENTSPTSSNNDGAISFNLNVPTTTRADQVGSAAATTLGNTFYVYGIKTESTDGAGAVGTGHTVFKNYVVKYGDNTAYTTTSNTKDWEYVGKALTTNEAANISATDGTAAQTIKYWDYGAPDYTFYAFSAKSEDINVASPKVTVVKNQTVTSSVYDNGYTVTLADGASLDNLFFSERVNIEKTETTDRNATNKYGGNVTLRFHNTSTKVRVAMYETIPGYTVTIDAFKVTDDDDPDFDDMDTEEEENFAANLVNNVAGTKGELVVKYISSGTTQNYPTVTFTPKGDNNANADPANILELGEGLKKGVVIGESITTATYDKTDDTSTTGIDESYTSVFPNETNSQNLKLKLNYTLTAPLTGETITVEDATAEIPADYLKWKPGFAYTYIFKISPNTNGSSGEPGTDPAGLYPITFDAVATVSEDGSAEYITTVSEPSITTFGVNSSGKYITSGNDYPAGSDIYATFMEGSTVKAPTLGGSGSQHVNIYAITYNENATDAQKAAFPITEASVAETLAHPATGNVIHYSNINADASVYFTAEPEAVTTVPGEDGVDITNTNALKLTGVKAGIYAIEYEASAAWTGPYKKVYKIVIVQ